jgi:hypothetical protein
MGAGRPFKYNVEQLKVLFEQYLIDRANQYDIRYELIKSGEQAGTVVEIKLPKVPTIASFCHFIDCTEKSFFNWINEESEQIEPELLQFITRVREIIKDKQLSGATNNVYNATITSRMNNLSDNLQVEHSGQSQAVNINIDGSKLDLTR